MLEIEKRYQDSLINYTFIDLFAGIGGFRYALESFGAKCVYSSEINKQARETYRLNHNEWPDGDITKVEAKSIPDFDILCAGFPCQAFSISGNQKGFEDSRGTLLFDILRIIEEKRPKILFLENVKNYSTHDKGRTMQFTRSAIEKLGYNFQYKVLNAKDFLLPQKRERTIMVAFRRDFEISRIEYPAKIANNVLVKDILEELNTDYLVKEKDLITFKLDIDKYNKVNYNSPMRMGTIKKGGQGDRIYSSKGIGITLSASSGGTGAKTGLYYFDGKVRKLTPREAARMQGFPEDFKFHESNVQMLKMFGNSVPINMLQAVMLEIVKVIKKVEEC